MRIMGGTILAAAVALSVHGAESRAEVMDMVHHNPGEPFTRTAFTDPGTLASYGYDAMVVNEFVFPQCAVTFDSFDRRVFPEGSPERAWVIAAGDRMREKCRKCHAAGLKCYYFMDIVVFPKRLVELYRDDVCGPDGRISFSRPLTRKLHRIMLDELFEAVPELDGLVVRTGETYLNNTPYHTGNGPVDYKNAYEESKEIHAELMNLLRDEVCVKHGKRVYYRTWDFGFFHTRPDYYLDVTERVEPHTNLVMAVKHTKGDYLRTFRFNPTLGIGRHRQIVEVQCAREYEGKGAFPNYIGESVIDGFEENAGDAGMKCLAEFAKSPLFAGVWTWSRGGGGQGPYLRNEFWCDMNAYVLSRWARHPEDGEETAFRSFAEKSGIAPESLADFRRLCLLSQKAIIRGRGTMLRCGDALPAYMKEPDNWLFVGWMRDDCLGGISELRKTMDGLIADGLLDARLGEMAEAVRIWKEIVGLAGGIRASDAAVASYLSTSARYGEILHRIMLHGCTVIFKGYEAEKRGCEPDRALISRAAADYDRAWADFYALKAERPDCASLFRDEYPFYVKRPGHSGATHAEGMGDAVRRYADRIFPVGSDVDYSETCESVAAESSFGELQPHLPELLRTDGGRAVDSAAMWESVRRPELVETLTREVYGRRPVERPGSLHFEAICPDKTMMSGSSIRKRVRATWSGPCGNGSFSFTAFIPSAARGAVPAFLFICNRDARENIDPERVRKSGFWPAEEIVARGYAAVAFYNGDVAPDFYDGFASGVYTAFESPDVKRMEPWGATWGSRDQESWGAVSAWAWGASRVMDWIETEPLIDSDRVAVVGHSRGGKTALWAAATDRRFAMACVNGSGECGAKLRHYGGYPQGQTIEDITRRFPHWFAWRFHRWMGRDRELPFDQHEVLALVAPRLLFVSNASQDEQEPEYLALKAASPAWELYGGKGFVTDGYPDFDAVQNEGDVAFRRRDGSHNLTPAEWRAYMDFADRNGWRRPLAAGE